MLFFSKKEKQKYDECGGGKEDVKKETHIHTQRRRERDRWGEGERKRQGGREGERG